MKMGKRLKEKQVLMKENPIISKGWEFRFQAILCKEINYKNKMMNINSNFNYYVSINVTYKLSSFIFHCESPTIGPINVKLAVLDPNLWIPFNVIVILFLFSIF